MSPKTDFDARAKDWSLGPVVYQVMPDRFVSPADAVAKALQFESPRRFRQWKETPKAGVKDDKAGYWTHELEFWGGDLNGVASKLGYIRELGADALYLTPVFRAYSNHKYDTTDYFQIAPEFGTMDDFEALKDATHASGMKLVLDGVFNHVGRQHGFFLDAMQNGHDAHRDWFFIGDEFKNGYRSFAGVVNLPAWRIENPRVREYLWGARDSVVQHWLRKGIDGWRLDVAFEIGPDYLEELTRAAHKAKPGSPVVGEIAGYPSDWFPGVDGTFNFFAVNLAKSMVTGSVRGGQAGQMLADMCADSPYENILKSWLVTDNHDTPRLAYEFPLQADRGFVQGLQFTLPGSPVVYYGTELGMTGGGDPECRAPMRWDLVSEKNKDFAWVKKLATVRRANPALRYGDFQALRTDRLVAFTRTTDKLRQSVLVVANPTKDHVTETFATRIGRVMSWGALKDELTGEYVRSITGMVTVPMPPRSVRIYTVVDDATSMGYSQYSRIK